MAYIKKFDFNDNCEHIMSEKQYQDLKEYEKAHTPKNDIAKKGINLKTIFKEETRIKEDNKNKIVIDFKK